MARPVVGPVLTTRCGPNNGYAFPFKPDAKGLEKSFAGIISCRPPSDGGGIAARDRSDIEETESAYQLTADLPGLEKSDINIELDRLALVGRGLAAARAR